MATSRFRHVLPLFPILCLAPAIGQDSDRSKRALTMLGTLCTHIGDPANARVFDADAVRQLISQDGNIILGKALADTDYFLYIAKPGLGSASLIAVSVSGTALPGAELSKLATFFAECPYNQIYATTHGSFFAFGGGKTADVLCSDYLSTVLSVAFGDAPLPNAIHFRITRETAQIVVSFEADPVIDSQTVRLHPDYK